MFEKATTSCIVVILFHVGFELISLCDVIGSVGRGGHYLFPGSHRTASDRKLGGGWEQG